MEKKTCKIALILGLLTYGCTAPVETQDASPAIEPSRHPCLVPGEEPEPSWSQKAEEVMEVWPADLMTSVCLKQGIRWLSVPQSEMAHWCGHPDATGCFTECSDFGTEPLIVISQEPGPQTVEHELAHRMMACSGRGGGNGDHSQELFLDTIAGLVAVGGTHGT